MMRGREGMCKMSTKTCFPCSTVMLCETERDQPVSLKFQVSVSKLKTTAT